MIISNTLISQVHTKIVYYLHVVAMVTLIYYTGASDESYESLYGYLHSFISTTFNLISWHVVSDIMLHFSRYCLKSMSANLPLSFVIC